MLIQFTIVIKSTNYLKFAFDENVTEYLLQQLMIHVGAQTKQKGIKEEY